MQCSPIGAGDDCLLSEAVAPLGKTVIHDQKGITRLQPIDRHFHWTAANRRHAGDCPFPCSAYSCLDDLSECEISP